MNKKNIYFKADEQLLTSITPNCFASDTVAYIEAHFDLGENWSGFDSVRAVWTNGAAVISSVLYDGVCIVPWEVLTKRAEVKVNLVGSNVENDELIDRLTTCQVPALNIKCKALIEGSNTATPTPSEYEQFVQNVHEDADRAEAARDEAEQILTDTEQIKTDVENLKTQTLAIKVETESIKGDVETLKSQTEDLVDGFGDEVEEALDRISAKEDDVLYDIDSAKTTALGEINNKQTIALAEIVNAKSSALTDISSARVTSLTEIQTEGTTQKNLVTTEGQTQVANVQTEGETQIQAIEDKGAEVIASIPNFAPIITDTVSGDIVSFTDGADGYPIKSLKVSLQPKQSGTGDPSPSNIRPISGWSGVTVYNTGVNVWDEEWKVISGHIESDGYIPVKPSTAYYWKAPGQPANGFVFYDSNKSVISTAYSFQGNIINTPSNCYFVSFKMGSAYGTAYNHDISINYPSTDTSYHSYHGQSHSISFPSTVYGGEGEIISGEWTSLLGVTHIKDLNWVKQAGFDCPNGTYFTATVVVPFVGWSNDGRESALCNALKKGSASVGASNADANTFWWNDGRTGYRAVWGQPNNASSLEDFIQFITDNDVVYVGLLANPTTFQTTPITDISSYKGNNTLWSDGAVECEYCCDTKLYINKLING